MISLETQHLVAHFHKMVGELSSFVGGFHVLVGHFDDFVGNPAFGCTLYTFRLELWLSLQLQFEVHKKCQCLD